jgi:hypothetical protein
LININAGGARMDHSRNMENNQNDAAHYVRKAEEYRAKARATPDARVRSGLEAVAQEYIRKARELKGAVPRLAGIQ